MTAQDPDTGPAVLPPRPPGCSDYRVNEAGWIGAPRLSWLLGARVFIEDGGW